MKDNSEFGIRNLELDGAAHDIYNRVWATPPYNSAFRIHKFSGGKTMDYRKESLRLHGEWKGKVEVVA
ncbi:MAG: hypothetical protein E7571_03280, partial [Ruminococcaceae bacterium]|nr:hypothetical protein [Oscillospiraceae bacterium]